MNQRRVGLWLAMTLVLLMMPLGMVAEEVTRTWEFNYDSYCDESASTLDGWKYSGGSRPFNMDYWYFQSYGHTMTSPMSFPAVIKRVTVTAGTNCYDGKITVNGETQEMPYSSYTPEYYMGMMMPTGMEMHDYVFENVTRSAMSPLVISFDYSEYLGLSKIVVEYESVPFGLTIGKMAIDSENISQFPGLSFNPDECLLTMNNVTLEEGIVSAWPNLKVKLLGTNTIQSEEFAFSTNVTAVSGSTSLEILAGNASARLLTNLPSGRFLYSGYDRLILPDGYAVSYDAYKHYSIARTLQLSHCYYAKVNDQDTEMNQLITEGNCDKVAGWLDETTGNMKVTLSYNAKTNTVTLDGYSNIVWGHYDDQYTLDCMNTDIENLTVNLKGSSTITTREDGGFFRGKNLTFTTDENAPGRLTIVRELVEDNTVGLFDMDVEGTAEPVFKNNLMWYEYPEQNTYCVKSAPYGITVAGVEVTEDNADNITGEGIRGEGTVSFDKKTQTLTLNNVSLYMDESTPVIVSNFKNLTLKINGTNEIRFNDDVAPSFIVKSVYTKSYLYIVSDDEANSSLFIHRGNELENMYDGFENVSYSTYFVAHHREGGEEICAYHDVTLYGVLTVNGQPSFGINTDGMDCTYNITYNAPELQSENVDWTPYDESLAGTIALQGACLVGVMCKHGNMTNGYYGQLYDVLDLKIVNKSPYADPLKYAHNPNTYPSTRTGELLYSYEMKENDIAWLDEEGNGIWINGTPGEVDVKCTITKGTLSRTLLNTPEQHTIKLVVTDPNAPFYYERMVGDEPVRNYIYWYDWKRQNSLDGKLTGIITPNGSNLPELKIEEGFLPNIGNLKYYIEDQNVATIDKTTGEITVKQWGASTVVGASLEYDYDIYACGYAEFTLITDEGSLLKVGDVSVTPENRSDVLGDGGSVQFDDKQTLVLRNAHLTAPIKSAMEHLNIYLVGDNTIETDGPCVIAQVEGPALTFTTDASKPGTLTLTTTGEEGVVQGFGHVDYDQGLLVMAQTDNSQQIAAPITPIVESDDQETQIAVAGAQGENLNGQIYDNVLYTLTEADSYNAANQNIDLYTTMVDDIDDVVNTCQPGTQEFADNFAGLTFMVPAGTGNVMVDAKTGADGVLGVKIGKEEPVSIRWNGDFKEFTIPYACTEATYVYIYNASQPVAALRPDGFRPAGKKTTITVGIRSVGAQAADVQVSNQVTGITTGRVPLSSSDVMYGAMGSTGAPAIVVANAPAVNELDQLSEGFFSSYGYASFIDLRNTSLAGINVSRTEGPFKGVSKNTFVFMPAGNSSEEPNVIIGAVCPNVQLDGNMPAGEMFGLPDNFNASKVTLNRSFDAQQATTIYLPIDIEAETAAELGTFYAFDRVENGYVKVDKVEDGLKAHTPYIFIPAADDVQISRRVAVVHSPEETAEARILVGEETPVVGSLVGCYAHYVPLDNDSYLFTAGADLEHTTFSRMQAAHSVLPFQAYLHCTGAEADELKVTDDESILGITTVSCDQKNAETWYTIDGIRLKNKPATKGVYISNGQQKLVR